MRSFLYLCAFLVACGNEPPTVTLVSPISGQAQYADLGIAVQATVSDGDPDKGELLIRWSSDIDGALTGADDIDDSGVVAGELDLSPGLHILTVEVEDPSGAVSTDAVAVNVAATNSPPRCEFTSPEASGAVRSGSAIDIGIAVDDADVGASGLTVDLRSDVDGELGPVIVAADGTGTLSVVLSDGTHALSLVATDELGATCEASLLTSFGSPPSVTINGPVVDFVEDIGQSIAFSATVADADDAASDLTIWWESDIDGVLSTAPADSSGVAEFARDFLSRGDHIVTVRVTDAMGFYDEASVALHVNGPPTPPVVTIDVENPATDEPLTVVILEDSMDAEVDTLTYSYAWYRDEELVDDLTGASVPADRTARDQAWRAEVWASDSRLNSERSAASTVILNTAPSANSVVLAPASPKTNDVVTATVETFDLDDDDISLIYEWSVNGTEISGVDGPSLDGAMHFDKRDTIAVRVTPRDDATSGQQLQSAAVTAVNSPPSQPTLETNPRYTYGDANSTCVVAEPSVDPDGDDITYTLEWTADGMAFPEDFPDADGPETVENSGDTVLSVDQDLADTFTCTVTASDGTVTTPTSTAFFDIIDGVYDVGYWREFPYTSILARNYLLGHPVIVPNDMTVVELGLIAKRTTSNGRIALYREVDGVPSELMVGSDVQQIRAGYNQFTVTPTPITAGTYWIMAAFDTTAYVGEDRGRHTVYYQAYTPTSDLPAQLSSVRSYSGYRHNYYLVGYE